MIISQIKYNSKNKYFPLNKGLLGVLFPLGALLFIFIGGCRSGLTYTKDLKQIQRLEDTLLVNTNWLNTLDYQTFVDRKNGIENNLFFLETVFKDTLSQENIELVNKYKDLERMYKFITKKVKWLKVETDRSFLQLNSLKEDMVANKAAEVSNAHTSYKNGLTMVQKNRIHLKDEVDVADKLLETSIDLRKKITMADYAYLNLSIEIRNLIDDIKSTVSNN